MGGLSSFWAGAGQQCGKHDARQRLLLWTALIGLVFGVLGLGRPVEDAFRSIRDLARERPGSGDIVLVAIDDRSLERVNAWPWPRRYHAQIIENLQRMGARRIFFTIDFSFASNPIDDRRLEEALAAAGKKVVLPAQFFGDPISGRRIDRLPLPRFRKYATMGAINLRYNYNGAVWRLPYSVQLEGRTYSSMATLLANPVRGTDEEFPIDYSIGRASIPTISAVDVIRNEVRAGSLSGKDVIVGATSGQLGNTFYRPGVGLLSGVYLHVLGAETLKSGRPMEIGWFLPFLLSLVIAAVALRFAKIRGSAALILSGMGAFVALAFFLEARLIYLKIVPALFVLALVGGIDAWRKFKQSQSLRANVNALSGLPNLDALRALSADQDRPLVAARILNYPEIASALPPEKEKILVEQIRARLTLGSSQTTLYQGDEGIFAWFADCASAANNLDALHMLFRSPVRVGEDMLDLTISFGLDVGSDRSLANRLGSALVAADEAAAQGLRWKEYDPAKLKDTAWKLSLLSQLDAAIDSGDFWVAYQPKLDLATNRIVGAEALARWSHPEKGPISPIEFILAAEQSDRIEKLTNYVLDQALARAAALNARGIDFGVSVNLSARLIDDPGLVTGVRKLLSKHQLPPECLTLEVTETVALAGHGGDFEALRELRQVGVQLSIDDYGTGLSTLDYLKKIPATEIKIDQSFVQSMVSSRSDALMVQSTIQLAHSLGQLVVAEGVEEAETLELLRVMGCDIVQGYLIGRPTTFRALSKQILTEVKKRVA